MITQNNQKAIVGHKVSLALHDIRSVHNVGAIFRTADALGVSKIYISGYTPTPIDRFGRERKDLVKTALGAEKSVVSESIADIFELIKEFKAGKGSNMVCAIEQDSRSINYKDFKVEQGVNYLFILGNEVTGLDKKILDKCDAILEIPMRGKKESLNVSVSAGIVLYELFG